MRGDPDAGAWKRLADWYAESERRSNVVNSFALGQGAAAVQRSNYLRGDMATPPETHHAHARRSNRWISVIIVVVATVVGAVLLFGFSLRHLFQGQAMPVDTTGAEREVVVSAEFLSTHLEGFLLRRDAERFRKTRYVDQRVELEYDYEQDGVELHTRIVFFGNAQEAQAHFGKQRKFLSTLIELLPPEANVMPLDDTYRWGERSAFVVVQREGELLGTYFVGFQEERVFTFWMEGANVENNDAVVNQLRQQLFALETYQP
ncbi:MAG: hypothetical protein CL681_09260 [Blastopirellula sp.]|nr:hypothetical protein [Blastopirellula sp.]